MQANCLRPYNQQGWGFYPNYLDSKAYILTILLMINQMLVIKDPVHRPQRKNGNLTKIHEPPSQGKKMACQIVLIYLESYLLKEFKKMLNNRFSLYMKVTSQSFSTLFLLHVLSYTNMLFPNPNSSALEVLIPFRKIRIFSQCPGLWN